jgi:hypothetical protein
MRRLCCEERQYGLGRRRLFDLLQGSLFCSAAHGVRADLRAAHDRGIRKRG